MIFFSVTLLDLQLKIIRMSWENVLAFLYLLYIYSVLTGFYAVGGFITNLPSQNDKLTPTQLDGGN